MRKTSYDNLPLLPHLMAEVVCTRVYTGYELSDRVRSAYDVADKEALRQKMTAEDIAEFCELADKRCRAAYAADIDWFLECVEAKDNRGRDQLFVWLTHWLASYLRKPEVLRRSCE